MAWTNIPNANLAAGAPIRSVDILALRDNIVALGNQESGAPTLVKSLNGQTGNITNTSLGAIGSYVVAFCTGINLNNVFNSLIGNTYAGSTLGRFPNGTRETWSSSLQESPTSLGLSGTWRLISNLQNSDPWGSTIYVKGLFVRVS